MRSVVYSQASIAIVPTVTADEVTEPSSARAVLRFASLRSSAIRSS